MQNSSIISKEKAIKLSLDFMDILAPGEELPFDKFLYDYSGMLTEPEREYGKILLKAMKNEEKSLKETLLSYIEKYPNDAKLGEAVRKMYNK